jgi:hypothetical protein
MDLRFDEPSELRDRRLLGKLAKTIRKRRALLLIRMVSFLHKRRLFVRQEWPFTISLTSLVLRLSLLPLLPIESIFAVAWTGLSLVMLVVGTKRIRRLRRSYDFPPRQADGVLRELSPSARNRTVRAGEEVFYPLPVPAVLSAGASDAPFVGEKYVLPAGLRALAHPIILGNRDRALIVDRAGIGLADIQDDRFKVRPLTYFQHLASNNAFRSYARPHGDANQDALHGYVVGKDGEPIPFPSSRLPNLIGISTIATTIEGWPIVVQSSHRNSGSPGLIHPSGSGSMEPKDIANTDPPIKAILGAMERELCEESSVKPSEIVDTRLIGFARWMNKGGMPEFFGVSTTTVPAEDLERRTPSGEDPLFVKRVIVLRDVRLTDLDVRVHRGTQTLDLKSLPATLAGSSSGPLAMLLWFLRIAAQPAGAA